MHEFERIRVEEGQAYIRDTGITVSEVVKKYLVEKNAQTLLENYPTLENEDLVEVLGYAVADLLESVGNWSNEGLTPLTYIEGYSALIIEDRHSTRFNEERQRHFLKGIHQASHKAIVAWWNFSGWIYETYRPSNDNWHLFSINEILEGVKRELPRYDPEARIDIRVTENLPPIKSNHQLPQIICILLTDRASSFLQENSTLEIKSTRKGIINFKIYRKFRYESSSSRNFDFSEEWRSSPISYAYLLIKRHNSVLKTSVSNNQLVYEFELPVWQENT